MSKPSWYSGYSSWYDLVWIEPSHLPVLQLELAILFFKLNPESRKRQNGEWVASAWYPSVYHPCISM